MAKKTFLWIFAIAVIIQFIRPDFKNPKVDETVALQADHKVMGVLKNACYDCHSNETKYPWYKNVAPVSWFMSDHINSGRKALDFSNWANIDTDTRLTRLKRAKHLIKVGLMPLGSYTWMHKEAILDEKQKETLEEFFDKEIQALQKS